MSEVCVPHLLGHSVNDGVSRREPHDLVVAAANHCGDWNAATHSLPQDKGVPHIQSCRSVVHTGIRTKCSVNQKQVFVHGIQHI